ncbi:hypothetical protein [Sphaerisporangium rubeum]|uniref:Uncharacterized protein n=1 Tax=Sphaerisporangium rubeum TaxID=321317 RepID=A0A7X0IFU8_9ACTN|nr:hypothetical protein [Sphaerisporangium rubeum]MBB6472917.1 hypothetical protein [Sphaerisporangium rubeum]
MKETLGRQHTIAQALLNAGFHPDATPSEYDTTSRSGIKLADQNGNLRPFSEIIDLGTTGYDELDRWFIANGMGGKENLAFGQLTNRYADRFEGRKERGMLRSLEFDR